MKSLVRFTGFSTMALSLLAIGVGTTAAQKECYSDSDCEKGQTCAFQAMSCSGVAPSQPGEQVPEPVCEPDGPGECVTECQDDSDCEENFVCEQETWGATVSCGSDGVCTDEEIAGQEIGTCRPGPIACQIDADCPEPLFCLIEQDCPPSADGTEVQCLAPTEAQCAFEPVECQSDADCRKGYECVVMGTSSECSGSGTAGSGAVPDCPPGSECPMPEPEVQEQCTTIEERMCFPVEAPCTTDSDCVYGWSCADFSTFPYIDSENGYFGPPWWNTGETGVAVACMPDGLIAVFEGHADAGGRSEEGSDAASSGGATYGESDSTEPPHGADEGGQSAAPQDDASAETASGDGESSGDGDGGGCNVVSGPAASPSWALALCALAALQLIRRRRR